MLHFSKWALSPYTLPVRELIQRDVAICHSYLLDPDCLDTLSTQEHLALKELKQYPNIVIKPADKGSKIVILDRQQNAFEVNKQLRSVKFYKEIPDTFQNQILMEMKVIMQTLYLSLLQPNKGTFFAARQNHKLEDLISYQRYTKSQRAGPSLSGYRRADPSSQIVAVSPTV